MDVDVTELAARMEAKFKKKRGRPKKPPSLAPPAWRKPLSEIQHADPRTLVDEMLVIAEWMQSSFKETIRRKLAGSEPKGILLEDVKVFEMMTSTLASAVRTLKSVDDVAEEMSSRMSGEQLLEASLKKLEAQEPQTIRWAIKRLRLALDRYSTEAAPQVTTASDAIAELANAD